MKNYVLFCISIGILISLLFTNLRSYSEVANEGYYRCPSRWEYLKADRHARGIRYTGDSDSLAHALVEPFENIHLRYKTIYSWIAFNIAYDFIGLNDRSKLAYLPFQVLDSMKTICGGYSLLMCYLCDKVGLQCEYVTGWAKIDTSNLLHLDWDKPEHAWNAIRINDEWRYCDVTWGAGYGDEKKGFTAHFTSAYFNMTAEKTSLQHFPEDKQWQREYTICKLDFDRQPLYLGNYFRSWSSFKITSVKYLKTNFMTCKWIFFETNERIRSVHTNTSQIAIPIINIGRKRIICLSPDIGEVLVEITFNNKATVVFINV